MIIHLITEDRSRFCVCGVTMPKNTTLLRELVTCKKCKNKINNTKRMVPSKSNFKIYQINKGEV